MRFTHPTWPATYSVVRRPTAGIGTAEWKTPGPGDRPTGEPPFPVLQIHGNQDRILPHRFTRPDVLVPGSGHLLPVTHADNVNQFLLGNMARLYESD